MAEKNLRYDNGSIEPLEIGEGFVRARVLFARDGVFPYVYPDGSIKMEAKLDSELLSSSTIESAKGKPICDGHPPLSDSQGLITPENYNRYVKGALGDSVSVINRDGINYLSAYETIFDPSLIESLKANEKLEVSIGFESDIDFTSGEYRGQRYDAVQRNIKINHIAHVEKGRAGDSVRAYLDSGINRIAVMQSQNIETQKENKENVMVKTPNIPRTKQDWKDFLKKIFKTDSSEELSEAADAIEAATEAVQTPEDANPQPADVKKSEDLIASLQNQITALQQVLEAKQKELESLMSPATQDALVTRRLSLVEIARSIDPAFKQDGLSNREIKLAVIGKTLPFPNADVSKLDESLIDARFDAAVELAREKASLRTDSKVDTVRIDESSIEKKREERKNLWGK